MVHLYGIRNCGTVRKALALMLENPSIIKRPVTVSGKTVSVGFDGDDFSKRFF